MTASTLRSMHADVMPDDDVPGTAGWWRARREQQTRRRRPRADGLSIERIIQTALDVIDVDGLELLTVRRLADALGTGSASLYRHVASRDELLILVVDHVLGEIVLPPAELSARRKVEWLTAQLRRVLMGHPNLLPSLTAAPLLGPHAMRGAENGLTNMREMGFDDEVAVPAYLAMIDYVLGTVYFDTSRAGRHRDIERVPTPPSFDDVFDFGVATFLDGLEARFLNRTD